MQKGNSQAGSSEEHQCVLRGRGSPQSLQTLKPRPGRSKHHRHHCRRAGVERETEEVGAGDSRLARAQPSPLPCRGPSPLKFAPTATLPWVFARVPVGGEYHPGQETARERRVKHLFQEATNRKHRTSLPPTLADVKMQRVWIWTITVCKPFKLGPACSTCKPELWKPGFLSEFSLKPTGQREQQR